MHGHRWLVPLCLATAFWAFSFGLGAPLASLWLKAGGYTETFIGLNTGTYFLGIVLTAAFVPRLMRRWGNGCLIVGMILTGLSVAAFPWGMPPAGWFVLRFLTGVGAALSLIPMETYISHVSTTQRRAQNFGYYAVCFGVGMALGTGIGIQLGENMPRLAFFLGGLAALAGGAVISLWKPAFPAEETGNSSSAPLELRRNFLSFGSAWSQGFLEGGMVALLPIYLLAVGLTVATVSWLMSGLLIGVIVAQVPLAWLADRLGRTRVLIGCYIVSMTGMGCLLVWLGVAWLAAWLFIVGACSAALYPLGLALLGDRTPPGSLARANAWYLTSNCLGSLTGPVIAGAAMECFGNDALFISGAGAVFLVLALWVGTKDRRAAVEAERPNAPARTAA